MELKDIIVSQAAQIAELLEEYKTARKGRDMWYKLYQENTTGAEKPSEKEAITKEGREPPTP